MKVVNVTPCFLFRKNIHSLNIQLFDNKKMVIAVSNPILIRTCAPDPLLAPPPQVGAGASKRGSAGPVEPHRNRSPRSRPLTRKALEQSVTHAQGQASSGGCARKGRGPRRPRGPIPAGPAGHGGSGLRLRFAPRGQTPHPRTPRHVRGPGGLKVINNIP